MPEETALVTVETDQVVTIFGDQKNMDALIGKIISETDNILDDVNTESGRKAISSRSRKIAKSRKYLDDLGKDLVSGWKQQAKVVDVVRKDMRERLDAQRDKVRKPLTDYEERERQRIDNHSEMIEKISKYSESEHNFVLTYDQIAERIKNLELIITDSSFEEFESMAISTKEATMAKLLQLLSTAKANEDAQKAKIESERVIEEANRIKKENEIAAQKIKDDEAAANQRIVNQQREADDRIQREKDHATQLKRESDQKIKDANDEAERIKQKARDEVELEAKLKIEANKRAQEEQIEKELREDNLERARIDNENHVHHIDSQITEDLQKIGFDSSQALNIITSIKNGSIRNVKITY